MGYGSSLLEYGGITLDRLPESGILIRGSRTVYVDPVDLEDYQIFAADIVMITHKHEGHLSIEDMQLVCRPDTMIVTNDDVAAMLAGMNIPEPDVLPPKGTFGARGIHVEAISAYMVEDRQEGASSDIRVATGDSVPSHPYEADGLGFIIEIDNVRIYHAGDTGLIPEMKLVKEIDIAVLPIAGWSVMSPHEAAAAVSILKPEVAVPVHYGRSWGSAEDAYLFQGMADCRVEVL
jgi:L-ascorbate metabolism protein UlaG (beta-lactamase superfamily)